MKENKWSAVIFPEGTRSRNGEIKPFAVGGVATLLKKVPEALVVPIVIKNSWRLVQYGIYPLSFGEKMTWQVLQPIEPGNRPAEEVIMQAEQAVREELKNN